MKTTPRFLERRLCGVVALSGVVDIFRLHAYALLDFKKRIDKEKMMLAGNDGKFLLDQIRYLHG
ncbi:hypothetical protein Leryth_009028 [Lithospermum erythrorhizon]|nr:hypothetical protein Leryth_009028 [Lithospermum erythrorhizon]